MTELESRMQAALMSVYHAFEDGWLVTLETDRLGDFMMVMNQVQAALVASQGGHRGKLAEKEDETCTP